MLEVLDLEVPGPLHLGGADDISRYDFALLLGADAETIERSQTTPDRAPDVTLDSSQAAELLTTRVRGVYDVLGPELTPALGGGAALRRRQEVLERHVQQRRLALGEPLVAVRDRRVDVQASAARLVEVGADQELGVDRDRPPVADEDPCGHRRERVPRRKQADRFVERPRDEPAVGDPGPP